MSEDILFPPLGHPAVLPRETAGSKAATLSGLAAAGFPVPAGLVVAAREYGIPAVVGTGNATHVLQTGQLVTVDGNAGTVEPHEG